MKNQADLYLGCSSAMEILFLDIGNGLFECPPAGTDRILELTIISKDVGR